MMKLFYGNKCPLSHKCKLFILEKQLEHLIDFCEIDCLDNNQKTNKIGRIPTLTIQNNIKLDGSSVICEYLEDIFPENSLINPTFSRDFLFRARVRQNIITFEKAIMPYVMLLEFNLNHFNIVDNFWLKPFLTLEEQKLQDSKKLFEILEIKKQQAREQIKKYFLLLSPICEQMPFLMGDKISLFDVSVIPILWRLNLYDIDLTKDNNKINIFPLQEYMKKMFQRPTFIKSLSAYERSLN